MKKKAVIHRCVRCGRSFPHAFRPLCDCGGLIDTEYDLGKVTFYESSNAQERYFDLLPIEDPENLLPVALPRTPCVHAQRLGEAIGLPYLYLKDETHNPTRTTKDRMAAIVLSYFKELGIREFCTSSTGNSSSALAHLAKFYPECRINLFTAEEFAERVLPGSGQVVHHVLRDATFVDAFACAGQYAARWRVTSEGGFFNPARREGLKLAYLEAFEQIPRPIDWYVQAVSSAMGVYGTAKAARELRALGRIERLPRLLCVQQATCAPMVTAFLEGSPTIRPHHVVARPTGIAKAILRGDPTRTYPYIVEMINESGGTCAAVSESEIREARCLVREHEGIDPCFSAASAFAGILKLVRAGRVAAGETVLVNLTGGDRPLDGVAPSECVWLTRVGDAWEPEASTATRGHGRRSSARS